MYVQIFLLIIGLGILYTYAREHGCGASCPLRARPDQLCSCACATCPCSPASRLQETLYSLRATMWHFYDAVVEMVKSKIHLSRPHVESGTQFCDLNTLSLSDYVIEDSATVAGRRSASLPNFAERASPAAPEAVGGTSPGVQTSNMWNTTVSNKLGEAAAKMPARCRKCREKGVTCMVKCPGAKK